MYNYGIDKVEFVTKKEKNDLDKYLKLFRPIKKIYGIIKTHNIPTNGKYAKLYKKLYSNGYRSRVVLYGITDKTFQYFIKNKIDFGHVNLVELYRDIECPDEGSAINLASRLCDHTYLKYHSNYSSLYIRNNFKHFIYANEFGIKKYDDEKIAKLEFYYYSRQKEKVTIGDRTLYLGELDFVHATYARNSKIDQRPVVRQEFRLKGRNIPRLLGVKVAKNKCLAELENLQVSRAPSVYECLDKKYIQYAEIKKEKFIRRCAELSNMKKNDDQKNYLLQMVNAHFKNKSWFIYTHKFIKYCADNQIDHRLYLENKSFSSFIL